MKKPVLFLPVLAFILSIIAIAAPLTTHAAVAFPINETFMGSTAPNWKLIGDATLTSGKDDPDGQGWLRLTTNQDKSGQGGQAGSAIYNNAFDSSAGIIAEFQYATYGADTSPGADGFSFYLIDGSVNSPTVGAQGAGLGYGPETQGVGAPGVTKGYVGIGFDEFGNFSTAKAGPCGTGPCANTPQSVTIRGAGDGTTGFKYLTQTKLSPNTVDNVSRAQARSVRITLTKQQQISVEIDYGAGYKPVITNFSLANNGTVPATFKLGFSASNWKPANYHEIRNLTVTSANPTTTTLATSTTSITYGQSVTFTATVKKVNVNPAGTPNGTVTFYDGSTVLGTAPVDATGKAVLTTTTLFAGTRTITATYGGDATFGSSKSTSVTVTVTGFTTTTTLTSTTTTSATGQPVTFTATVSSANGTPTGQVTFLDGTKSIGTANLDGTGTATFTTSSLKSGSHSITARYDGYAAFQTSTSAAVTVTVSTITFTTVTLTASSSSSAAGQTATFTVNVSGGGKAASGTVTIFDGNTQIGVITLDGSGKGTFTTSSLSKGSHTITAKYEGDANFSSNSSSVTFNVTGTTVTTTTFTGTITNKTATFSLNVSGNGGTPSGKVTFRDGTTVIGTATLDASGKATFTTSTLTNGSHTFTATYEGDDTFASSTSTLTLTVAGSTSTTTTFTAKVINQTATFTVTVAGSGSTATGTVTFLEGDKVIGTATLDAKGVATFTTSSLSGGTHTITARYEGDATYASSTATVTVTIVSIKATTTTVTVTQSGQTFTFNTHVAGQGGTPTGTVTFFDGTTQIGTGTLDANGNVTFTTSTLTSGTHTITVQYGGDSAFSGSSSGLTLTLTGTTFTAISLSTTTSTSTSAVGQPIILVATVTSGSGTPTGIVTFFDGSTLLGPATLDGSGRAVFTTTSLGEGPHTITAHYEGDGTYPPITSPQLILTVNTPSASPADLSVTQTYEINFVRDITFTIVARNNGANAADGAVLSDIPLPATLNNTGWTWTCTASNGATCSASGTGEINDTLTSFPSGGIVTYTVKGSLEDWSRWTNTVRIIAPASITESDMSNNSVTIGRYQVLLPQMTRL